MSIETVLVTKVGDGKPAISATATMTCDDTALVLSDTVTVIDPLGATVVFTEGTDFNKGSGDDVLAEELKVLIDGISGLSATRVTNVVTIVVDIPSEAGNNRSLETLNVLAFVIVNFNGGKDLDKAVDLEMTLDKDAMLTVTVDSVIVFRVPYTAIFSDNQTTFQVNLQNFLRKAIC